MSATDILLETIKEDGYTYRSLVSDIEPKLKELRQKQGEIAGRILDDQKRSRPATAEQVQAINDRLDNLESSLVTLIAAILEKTHGPSPN